MNTELPPDLVERGWKLMQSASGHMYAISVSWGATGSFDTLADVVKQARDLVRYFEWRAKKAKESL